MADEEKLRMLFDKFDDNKNGIIERTECKKMFTQIISELGENLKPGQIDEIVNTAMNKFDSNKNGQIEFNEFREIVDFLINDKGYDLH